MPPWSVKSSLHFHTVFNFSSSNSSSCNKFSSGNKNNIIIQIHYAILSE